VQLTVNVRPATPDRKAAEEAKTKAFMALSVDPIEKKDLEM
jgi:hypothetical protein